MSTSCPFVVYGLCMSICRKHRERSANGLAAASAPDAIRDEIALMAVSKTLPPERFARPMRRDSPVRREPGAGVRGKAGALRDLAEARLAHDRPPAEE